MAEVLQVNSGVISLIGGQTRYFTAANSSLQAQSTEAYAEIPYRTAGTLSLMGIRVTAASGTTAVRIRKNGANGSTIFTFNTTGYFEETGGVTDSVTAGDKIALLVATGPIATCTFTALTTTWEATGTTTCHYAAVSARELYNSLEEFTNLAEENVVQCLVEERSEFEASAAGKFKNMSMYLAANNGGTFDGTLLKNQVNGIVVTASAATAGLFENTSDEVTVASGDTFCFSWDGNSAIGGTTQTPQFIAVEWESTNGSHHVIGGYSGSWGLISPAIYTTIGGDPTTGTGTEANAQVEANHAGRVSDLKTYSETNGIAGDYFSLKISGVQRLNCRLPVGTTGWARSNNLADFAATDTFNLESSYAPEIYTYCFLISRPTVTVNILGNANIKGNCSIAGA